MADNQTTPKRIQRKRVKGNRRGYVPDRNKAWRESPSRPRAKCHPDKPHRARRMCDACYDRWLYANSPGHKSQKKQSTTNYRARYPDRKAKSDQRSRLIRRYGLTTEQVDNMHRAQNGQCAICGRSDLPLAIDHSHYIGTPRALLCLPCNGSLGWLERLLNSDTETWVASATQYLERFHASANSTSE